MKGVQLPEDLVAQRLSGKGKRRRRLTLPFRIFLVLLLLLIVASTGAVIFYRWWLADPERVRAFAEEKMSLLLPGKKVSVGSADFSLLDGLDLFEMRVTDEATGFEVARMNHVKARLDLGSLLEFSLLIESVEASGLFLDLSRSKDGQWNLSLPAPSGSGADVVKRPFSIMLQGAFVSLDDRALDFAVSFRVDKVDIGLFSGSGGSDQWRVSADFGEGLLGKWRISGHYDVTDREVEAKFKVIDLELGKGLRARMPPFARRVHDMFEPSGLADASGRVTYSPEAGSDFDVKVVLKGCTARYAKFPVPGSDIEGTLHFTPEGVGFEGLDCRGMGGSVVLGGQTVGYGREAAVEVSFNTEGTHVTDDLLDALPDKVAGVIAGFDPAGPADVEVQLKRPAGPQKPYDVSLLARPRGMTVTYDGFPLKVDGVTGKLAYTNGDLDIADVAGRHGDMRVSVSGLVKSLTRESEVGMRVVATRIRLEEKIRTLLPQGPADFWKSLEPSGEVDAEVMLSKPPGQPLGVGVNVRLADVSVLFDLFPYPLSGGRGEFSYEDGRVTINEPIRFTRDGINVGVSGTVDTAGGEANIVVSATDLEIDEQLSRALPEEYRAQLATLRVSGRADASAVVSRAADGTIAVGEMKAQMRSARLRPDAVPLAMGNAAASVTIDDEGVEIKGFEALYYPENALVLLPLVRLAFLARPTSRLAATGGQIREDGLLSWDGCFDLEHVFMEETLAGRIHPRLSSIVEKNNIRGFLGLRGDFEYNDWGEERELLYNFTARCTGLSMDFGKRFTNVNGEIRVEGDTYNGSGGFLARGRLASLEVDGEPAGETTFALEGSPGETTLRSFDMSVLGGRISGQARLPASGDSAYALSAELKDVALAGILEQAFGFRKERLGGKTTGKVEAVCLTGETQNLIGSCEITVNEGELWEVPMVLAVFNVLNLKVPERSQFTEARLRCNFAHGRLMVSEFSMASNPATIFGKGTITFGGTLDMEFHSYLGRIPVISLVGGEMLKHVIVARATGTFAEPKVTLAASGPFAAFLDVLKRPFRRER
ncbi:MAG: hypothetical protein ACYTAN_05605 [Planctomycetota bacterium]